MKNRSIWKMLGLSIITLGIYQLYWYVKTRREMMALDPKVKILSPWFLVVPVIIIVLSFFIFIASTINDAASLPAYCQSHTALNSQQFEECTANPQVLPAILFYISIILIWPLTIVWLWGYSKGVEIVTKGKTSFAVALLVLLVVPYGIDILIIQDGFNKLPAKAS